MPSERLVPAVPRHSLHPFHALSTPVAVCSVLRHPSRLVPGGLYTPGFDDTWLLNDALSKGSLSFVSRTLTCASYSRAFPPTLTTTALYRSSLEVVWDLLLKADPEGPALICCAACAHGYLVHGELPIRVLLQHAKAKKENIQILTSMSRTRIRRPTMRFSPAVAFYLDVRSAYSCREIANS